LKNKPYLTPTVQYFFTNLRYGWTFPLALAFVCAAYGWIGPARAEPGDGLAVSAARPPGTIIDVGTHRLHLYCRGRGAPTVLLEAGLGGFSLEWADLQQRLAEQVRVCAYDRAGYGWSDPGPLPRTARQIVSELIELLQRSAEPVPIVIAGHSFGGYVAQLLAKTRPDLVAGLVLLDSSHPLQHQRLPHPAGKTVGDLGARSRLVSWALPPPGYPEAFRTLAFHLMQQPWAVRAQRAELLDFEASAEQVRAAGAIASIPAIVVTRGARVWPRTPEGDRFEQSWARLQKDLAAAIPGAVQRIAPEAGHYVHLDAPALVERAIEDVVAQVRCAHAAAGRDAAETLASFDAQQFDIEDQGLVRTNR
jgi:pimeloyl-ACP methyl ester carboxylesterase